VCEHRDAYAAVQDTDERRKKKNAVQKRKEKKNTVT